MNLDELKQFLVQRASDWSTHQLRWRWLLDSFEGGERYRQAIYGADFHGLPLRNLVRHKREKPDPREYPSGSSQYGNATYLGGIAQGMAGGQVGSQMTADPTQYAEMDDYEMRRARTPVPTFVAEVIDTYVSTIFANEIKRDVPSSNAGEESVPLPEYQPLVDWWENVDGMGTNVDDWMKDTIGPLLLTLGCLDLVFDHPRAVKGSKIASLADAKEAGVDKCVAGYILPDNMFWYRKDSKGRYIECLVREFIDSTEEISGTGLGPTSTITTAKYNLRHWTDKDSTLYDVKANVLEKYEHSYGRPPIIRIFDRRKPRNRHVGLPRLENIAEMQREYYNKDSELILSDTTQAHPLLQGPEDYVQADGTMPIGPNWLLPKKKNNTGGTTSYEGFEVVEFPKAGADSIRENLDRLREAVDRAALLMKPAGAAGTKRGTVEQSGVSKGYDHDMLHRRLSAIAKALAKCERDAALLAMLVLTDGSPPIDGDEDGDMDLVEIMYPTVFNLYAADELAKIAGDFQSILAAAGDTPTIEAAILSEIVRKALPGRNDEQYEEFDDEIKASLKTHAKLMDQQLEGEMQVAKVTASTPLITEADEGMSQAPEAP